MTLTNKATYTFIKNSIPVVAEDMGTSGYNTKINEERNQGGFIMSSEAMDINNLLSRSQALTRKHGKEGEE